MVTISIVSHGHGTMVVSLINQLLRLPEVGQIVLTANIPEKLDLPLDSKIMILKNEFPLGFAANHNRAFELSKESYFCPLNPDIELLNNPFPTLLSLFIDAKVGMVAPQVNSPNGFREDSWRRFPNPFSIILKLLIKSDGTYELPNNALPFSPDWVAGMFMLFSSDVFRSLGGFDQKFFLYYEDVDICARLRLSGYKLLTSNTVAVVHNARRDSRRKWRHFVWHLSSMARFFLKHTGRLPTNKS